MLILYGSVMVTALVAAAVLKAMPQDKRIRFTSRFLSERMMSGIRKTDPSGDVLKTCSEFVMHKLMVALLVVCAGSFFTFMYELKELGTNELIGGNRIMRNGYGEEPKRVKLRVSDEDHGGSDVIEVKISERKYTDEELDAMAAQTEEIIYDSVLLENGSLDRICSDMYFPASIEGYPFRLAWRTDDPLLINNRGVIDRERLDRLGKDKDISAGVLTGIHVELVYEDYLKEIDFYARIYPDETDNELTLAQFMDRLIREEDEATRTEEYVRLPDKAGDIRVGYEQLHDNGAVILMVMTLILSAGLFIREDKELDNRVKDRDKQLIADYPGMVNKFVLFYSAGLTTRGIISKLCGDYRRKLNEGEEKRYLYEEMLICEGRMNEGLGELSAYEGFSARCGLHKYRQFISLVIQAAGKGRADLLPLLDREATEAFEERKNRAKELGEEAGTKLLFPMLMMLLVVLIIVMVPAFISFRN